MDTGTRKSGLALTVAVGLLAAGEYNLAVLVAVGYLAVNAILHLAGKNDVDPNN
jgi:hypothetical protein